MFLLSLRAMINTEKRTLRASLCVADAEVNNSIHIGGAQIFLTDCLTVCYFHRTVCKQKIIRRNLTVSQYFRPVVKMGPQPRKTSVTLK